MTEVHFKDGDLVKEGDLLFKIDPRQYKAELDGPKATSSSSRPTRIASKKSITAPRSCSAAGRSVTKSTIDTSPTSRRPRPTCKLAKSEPRPRAAQLRLVRGTGEHFGTAQPADGRPGKPGQG